MYLVRPEHSLHHCACAQGQRGHRGDKLPVHYQDRTWESCIRSGSMNGTQFQLHKVSKDDIFDYKGFYENPDNVLQKLGCVPR